MGQAAGRPKKPGKEETEEEDVWKNNGFGELSHILRNSVCNTHAQGQTHSKDFRGVLLAGLWALHRQEVKAKAEL